MISTLTSKGQMTLPKEIRDRFKLKAGDRLDIVAETNRIVLIPATVTLEDLTKLLPRPKKKASLAEMDRAIRRRAAERSA